VLTARRPASQRATRRDRRQAVGFTLAELVVALTVGVVVIAIAGMLGSRQQRFNHELSQAGERLDQVDQIASLLPVDLRSISAIDGDIVPGQARDTSIQLRATIASAVVCDTTGGNAALAPATATDPLLGAFLSSPQAGDTAWGLSVRDTAGWQAIPIQSVSTDAGRCMIGGVDVHTAGPPLSRVVLHWATTPQFPVEPGTPLRITRPVWYGLYRGSDGEWYLGAKDWNAPGSRFNTVQPVAGPFLSASKGGLILRYSDSLGVSVAPGAMDTRGIALIDITIQSDSGSKREGMFFGNASRRAGVKIGIRNRRKGGGP
jgi:hypothetical protein